MAHLPLDWLAMGVGAVGTLLWAHNCRHSKFAAAWWLTSSILWMAFAWVEGLPALGARDCLSVVLYLYGGWRWLRPQGAGACSSARRQDAPESGFAQL